MNQSTSEEDDQPQPRKSRNTINIPKPIATPPSAKMLTIAEKATEEEQAKKHGMSVRFQRRAERNERNKFCYKPNHPDRSEPISF